MPHLVMGVARKDLQCALLYSFARNHVSANRYPRPNPGPCTDLNAGKDGNVDAGSDTVAQDGTELPSLTVNPLSSDLRGDVRVVESEIRGDCTRPKRLAFSENVI